jgi:hypothetical protein
MLGAAFTLRDVPLHADKLDTGEHVIDESAVIVLKLAAVHEAGSEVRVPVPGSAALVPQTL